MAKDIFIGFIIGLLILIYLQGRANAVLLKQILKAEAIIERN